jgi:putative tryptophan/tyrosine transport system substrate-binding protein
VKRREFIAGLGSTAAWPLAARAQQPAMPVVGYLDTGLRAASSSREAAFRDGLGGMGFVEGRNVAIDYRYAESQNERLPELVADLVRRPVAAIYALGAGPALTAKAATTTIPIVFRTGGDPVQLGLVTTLNRPGGNMTGVSRLTTTTAAIRIQILHEAIPSATVMGLLVNPTNPIAELDTREAQDAARKLGLELHVVGASNAQEIDAAFATLVQKRAQALFIDGNAVFSSRRQQLAALMVRHAMPAIYVSRDFPEAGGLMSYGASVVDADRLGGTYVGRILKGDKPADLPVQQSAKIELVINLIAAKVLGVALPPTLLAIADEVIE